MTITAGTAQAAIQAAVYTLLRGDSTLMALGAIYDAVPEATVDDYLAFGDWTEAADDTLEADNAGIGSDCTFTLDIYTDDARGSAGFKKSQSMLSRAKVLLHGTTLTVTGYTCVICQFEESVSLRDVDNQNRPKRHIVATFRVFVEAT